MAIDYYSPAEIYQNQACHYTEDEVGNIDYECPMHPSGHANNDDSNKRHIGITPCSCVP